MNRAEISSIISTMKSDKSVTAKVAKQVAETYFGGGKAPSSAKAAYSLIATRSAEISRGAQQVIVASKSRPLAIAVGAGVSATVAPSVGGTEALAASGKADTASKSAPAAAAQASSSSTPNTDLQKPSTELNFKQTVGAAALGAGVSMILGGGLRTQAVGNTIAIAGAATSVVGFVEKAASGAYSNSPSPTPSGSTDIARQAAARTAADMGAKQTVGVAPTGGSGPAAGSSQEDRGKGRVDPYARMQNGTMVQVSGYQLPR